MGRQKKCRNLENIQPVLKRALEEYLPNVMTDEEEMFKLKSIIQDLPEVDKIIFLAYVELRSFTELSRVLNVSRSTCFWVVKRIREEILTRYRKSI